MNANDIFRKSGRAIAVLLVVMQLLAPSGSVFAADGETGTSTGESTTEASTDNGSEETVFAGDVPDEADNEAAASETSTSETDTANTATTTDETEDQAPIGTVLEISTTTETFTFATSTPNACQNGGEATSSPSGTSTDSVASPDCGGMFLEQHATSTAGTTTTASAAIADASATPGASGDEGGDTRDRSNPIIVSGRAIALANILNIVNTNLVNSTGYVVFANLWGGLVGGVDLRRDGAGSSTEDGCALLSCVGGDSTFINLLNDAVIENLIRINATSGANAITEAGGAAIATGPAYAGLNLVNFANANFVDAQYLLAALNVFQDMNGDIVFPGLAKFANAYAVSTPPQAGEGQADATIGIANDALVDNDLRVDANAGGNVVTETGSSTIRTGDAFSTTNVFNQLNTSLLGDMNVSILLRVHGSWSGNVEGAPEWLTLRRGGDGTFYLSGAAPGAGGGSDAWGSLVGTLDVGATNTARIRNDAEVTALSGANAVQDAESALITTGDAAAGANIINIANTNVIGGNWLRAVINIFGDFSGNIVFGRPDLWVGAQASPGQLQNGGEATYRFSVINNGDRVATGVRLVDRYDKMHSTILESSFAYTLDDEGYPVWEIGALPPGMGTEITYKARIHDAPPATLITDTVTVMGTETDNNETDNTDTVSIIANPAGYGGLGGGSANVNDLYPRATPPQSGEGQAAALHLSVTRTSTSTTVTTFGTSTQSLLVRNPHDTAIPSVTFIDELRDPSGALVRTETWDLGTVLAHEEITIGYDIAFRASATSGTYLLSSMVKRPGLGNRVYEANGKITFTALSQASGEVAGDSAATTMSPVTTANIEATRVVVPEPFGTVFAEVAHADAGDVLGVATNAPGALWGRLTDLLLYVLFVLLAVLATWSIERVLRVARENEK